MADHSGLPADFDSSRAGLHRIAAHLLGRRRYEAAARFGLRASPGGFATPAFGADCEIVRFARGALICETVQGARYAEVAGSTLAQLADFVGCELSTDFSVGSDTPPLGDIHEPLALGGEACAVIAAWYHLGWQVLDEVVAGLDKAEASPAVIQLWPEHFDAGTNVAVPNGDRVNLGVSPGDAFCNEPYLYIGPWSDDRPGNPAFWNASFGAVLGRSELVARLDPIRGGIEFMRSGLALFGAGSVG